VEGFRNILAALWGVCAAVLAFACSEPPGPLEVRCLEALDYRSPGHGEVESVEQTPAEGGTVVTIRYRAEEEDADPAHRYALCEFADGDRWVLQQMVHEGAALPETAEPIRIAVDAPAGYVATGAMVADVEAALRRSGLAPERLVLEIGDATVTSTEDREGMDIATLRLMGVHVALAGFGGDSSMLTHLTRLPIDIVKLDRAFVSRIDRDPRMRAAMRLPPPRNPATEPCGCAAWSN